MYSKGRKENISMIHNRRSVLLRRAQAGIVPCVHDCVGGWEGVGVCARDRHATVAAHRASSSSSECSTSVPLRMVGRSMCSLTSRRMCRSASYLGQSWRICCRIWKGIPQGQSSGSVGTCVRRTRRASRHTIPRDRILCQWTRGGTRTGTVLSLCSRIPCYPNKELGPTTPGTVRKS